MRNISNYLIIVLLCSFNLFAQNNNQSWLIGRGQGGALKNVSLSFNPGFSDSLISNNLIPLLATLTSYTDSSGKIIAITNGIKMYNLNRQVMLNGDSLNPCAFTNQYPLGLPLTQSHILLPKPGDLNKLILIHESLNLNLGNVSPYFYNAPGNLLLSEIDMAIDSGKGGITKKNKVILSDTLTLGRIVATKHANGRDWWVITHTALHENFYKLLITPDTVLVFQQIIGVTINFPNDGYACFSPDGSKYAVISDRNIVTIYAFDRCTGQLSNPQDLIFNLGGNFDSFSCIFSANSRFLYVNTELYVYQYDTWASNITLSQVLVATYDGFTGPLSTYFCLAALGINNKIYISTANGSYYLHVIESPDSLGLSCNLVQHPIQLPTLNIHAMPNLPNYTLGPLTGSGCDTLTGITALQQPINEIVIAPNPTTGVIRISSANLKNTVCNVYNSMGELILEFNITNEKDQPLDLFSFKNGLYLIQVISAQGDLIGSQKLVLAK